jgi:3-dehydroquinate dehydratase-2
MKIGIINGPNLNLLGVREPQIYGKLGFETFLDHLKDQYPDIAFSYYQSNVEGELIDAIQQMGMALDGILLNPGGYTHTSVAIGDAISAVTAPVIEIHISNVHAREDFRKISHVSAKAKGTISGLGLEGYRLGVEYFNTLGIRH